MKPWSIGFKGQCMDKDDTKSISELIVAAVASGMTVKKVAMMFHLPRHVIRKICNVAGITLRTYICPRCGMPFTGKSTKYCSRACARPRTTVVDVTSKESVRENVAGITLRTYICPRCGMPFTGKSTKYCSRACARPRTQIQARRIEQTQAITAAVASGKSVREVAQAFGVSVGRVYRYCKKAGVATPIYSSPRTYICPRCGKSFTHQRRLYCSKACAYQKLPSKQNPERDQAITAAVVSGKSVREMAQAFGVSPQRIYQILKKTDASPMRQPTPMRVCLECGKPVTYKRRKYCSNMCRKQAMRLREGSTRICTRCKETKAIELFYIKRKHPYELHYSQCKTCWAAINLEYRSRKRKATAQ